MRATGVLVVLGLIGCASSPPATVGDPTAGEGTITLEKSPDSGQVDRVGPSDGALGPDGTNDLGFVTQVDGPIGALFLVAVDEAGKPTGTFQADTLIGESESPVELSTKPGSSTSGLGVFESDKPLNSKDGALDPLGVGPHRLTLYVAPSEAVTSGTMLRVYALRPDKSLVAGATVTH